MSSIRATSRAEIEQGRAEDVAIISYTSGTTGNPKGAMITHANAIGVAESFRQASQLVPEDTSLAYLPMAWAGDSVYTLFASLVVGFCANCPESPETVQRDLRELGPTTLLAPPRIWENMLTAVQVRAADATPLKRRTFEYFRAAAERAEILRAEGKPVPARLRLATALGEFFVYGPVRDQLGLAAGEVGADRRRTPRSRHLPLLPVDRRQPQAGLRLHRDDRARLAAARPRRPIRPPPGGRCRGSRSRSRTAARCWCGGAPCSRATSRTRRRPARSIDPDGWFHTGDAGFIDPRGHLVIIDRAKDVGALTDGTPFAPQFIENKLKFSPYVREAVAFGHDKPFVAAMIAIDLGTVGNWAERRGIPYTSYMDLSQKPEVRELIRDEIRRGNETLPEGTRIRRFLLLTKDLEADDAEMTRTRKVRRRYVADKYATVIDALYGGAAEAELSTGITYEDGRQATIQSRMRIEDVAEAAAGV